MKIKKPVSILLCFCLMVGFLSGTALADSTALPDGHAQLYIYGDATFSTSAGGSRGLVLSLDAEQTNTVTGTGYTVTCSDGLGSIDWDESLSLWFWRANSALPGASGYITATDGTNNYSIAVAVEPAVIGVYTASSIDSNDPGKNYVPAVNGSHTVSCVGDNAIRTLYFIPGYENISILADSTETPITSSNEMVTCELLSSGVLAVSVSNEFTGSAAFAEITFFVQEVYGNNSNTSEFGFAVTFEGEQSSGDGSGSQLLQEGFYTALSESGELSGYVEPVEGTAVISYTALEQKVVYLYFPNADAEPSSLTSDSAAVSTATTNFNGIFKITLAAGTRGTFEDYIHYVIENDEGTFTPGKNVCFTDNSYQLYFKDGETYSPVIMQQAGNSMSATLTIDENGTATDGTYAYSCSEGLGSVSWDADNNCVVWNAETAVPGEGWLCASKGGMDYVLTIAVLEAGNPGGNNLVLISEARDMQESDYAVPISTTTAAVPFVYNGNNYCMAAHLTGDNYPNMGGGMNFAMSAGDTRLVTFDIAIWVDMGNDEYALVTDAELLAEIEAAFGNTLQLQIKASSNDTAPLQYPAIYQGEETGYFLPTTLELGLDNTARWIITATGTIDGQELSSQCFLNWTPFEATVFTPTSANDDDVIDEINTYLSSLTPNANTTIIINLPAGEFSGYIDIPQFDGRLNVTIEGAGADQTTLIGGIYANSVRVATHVYGVNFRGAGAGNLSWAADHATNANRPNRGIYGASMGSADYCVFTGYDYALYSRDCTYSKFYDNNVAICVDHAVAESNGVMSWSWFENNGVAIEFKNVLSSRAMSTFTIVENCFISNTKDIQDDVQRNIFVPGCYFADRENGVLTVRECRTDEHVMYYPQAANTEFTEFIYDTDWYNVDKIVICANFTATFPIPEEYLDGNFTIMNADGSANLGTWQFNQRGGRQ